MFLTRGTPMCEVFGVIIHGWPEESTSLDFLMSVECPLYVPYKVRDKLSLLLILVTHMKESDEDIATLDTLTLWSFPSCNSSPTHLPRHPRIQQTCHHCFGHNSLIRHQNGAFLDALERGR
jgi:hypothetical protein